MKLRQCFGLNGKMFLGFVRGSNNNIVKWKDNVNCKRLYLLKKICDATLGKYTPDLSASGIIGEVNQLSTTGISVLSNLNSSYLKCGTLNDIVYPNIPLTFVGWFKLINYGTTNNSRLFSRLDASSRGIEFRIENGLGSLKFIVISSTGGNTVKQTANLFPLNINTFVALTWDGSGNANDIHIYLNGLETPYIVSQNGGINAPVAGYPLYIGNKKTFDRAVFGTYEKLAFFDKVLTQEEIIDIMLNGLI